MGLLDHSYIHHCLTRKLVLMWRTCVLIFCLAKMLFLSRVYSPKDTNMRKSGPVYEPHFYLITTFPQTILPNPAFEISLHHLGCLRLVGGRHIPLQLEVVKANEGVLEPH